MDNSVREVLHDEVQDIIDGATDKNGVVWSYTAATEILDLPRIRQTWEQPVDNEHIVIAYTAPSRCPKCGRKLEDGEAVSVEPDALEPGKAKAWHPECYPTERGRW